MKDRQRRSSHSWCKLRRVREEYSAEERTSCLVKSVEERTLVAWLVEERELAAQSVQERNSLISQ